MYQFIHYENYSINVSKKIAENKKKKSENDEKFIGDYNNESSGSNLREVIAEARREPGNTPHIKNVEPPALLYGVDLEEVERMALEYHSQTKIDVEVKGEIKQRGLRKDANIILAGVVSLPADHMQIWDDYKKDAIEYLKLKYGNKLKCVVEHTDEENPHIHYYCIQDIGEKFDLIHDGKKALLDNKNKIKSEQNKAYRKAMRDFQEDFFLSVSSKYGLMKDGPKRRRMPHSEAVRVRENIKLLNELKKKHEAEINLLKIKQQEELKKQKEKEKSDISFLKEKTLATARSVGRKEGYQEAISKFNDKNFLNKFIFSKKFTDSIIKKNKDLSEKYKDMRERKEMYKSKYSNAIKYKSIYMEEKASNKYFNEINDFINEMTPIDQEKKDDIRRNIVAEINRIETQQQQINSRYEAIRPRNDRNRKTIDNFRQRFKRSSRMFFNHFKTFVRDIFSNSVFERAIEIERKEKINIQKIEYKKEDEKVENRQDGKFVRKRKKLEIQ
ncbi:plasmid recombination protein [Klebsiella pneumoniae]|uniref:plasmid recombination protein n=1 Tax=Klebsiella pneumoniae TaxID=573 RepID=UPI003BF75A73